MSSSSTDISKVDITSHSRENGPASDTKDESLNDARKLAQCYNGNSPSRSRYGRTIKPKSPQNENVSSPKTSKMPKTRKQQNSIDSSSETIEDNVIGNDDKGSVASNASNASSATNAMEENESPKTVNPPLNSEFALGQLAWARVGNFPFWPCVVTLDPESMTYQKLKAAGRTQVTMMHVQYFGDKGRHSWVSANSMMNFTSLEDFKKLSESLTAEMKKKDAKYAAAFVVKPGVKSKWESAVSEAMEIKSMTNEERIEVFKPKTKNLRSRLSKNSDPDEKEKNGKRKYSSDSSGPDTKRTRQDNVNGVEKSHYKTETQKLKNLKYNVYGKSGIRLNSESPPASPSTRKETADKVLGTQTVEFRGEEDVEGVFEVYYERNRDMLEDEYPDATENDIRKYLKKTWENMNSSFRKKYRSYITSDRSTNSKESLSDHDDDSHVSAEEPIKEEKKLRSKLDREDVSSVSEPKRTKPYNLFKGTKQEKVCQICEKTGKLTRCRGPCYSYFHLSCVKPGESSPEHSMDESTTDGTLFENAKENRKSPDEDESNGKSEEPDDETFKCIDCLSGVAPACFICNEREGDRIRCSVLACGKHYHSTCLKTWPQSHWQGGRLSCPYHVCHTCSSDNPQDNHSRASSEKLARCVRCPSSYHTAATCLPAGSVVLTGSQIVCPKHYKAPHPPLNAAWCFLCTRGGSLICCDTCPTSFHPECLGINAPDGAFICEDCETGRLPLYGEVVWVKLGNYRWWPSRICYPQEIPENIEAIPHSAGKFCVMFLGSNNYYWVHRGRAFLYQDGDANIKPSIGKKTMRDDTYRRALEEANDFHQRLKVERAAASRGHGPRGLKPPPYVKLKVNKPVGNVKPAEVDSIVACDCDAEWDNPCAPGTDCLNRILLVECNPNICPAGAKCNNQAFVRRQYPTMEPFHTAGRGWGLRCLEAISAGQFVIEYVGEVIDEAEYRRRLHLKKELKNENFYFLTIDNNRTIDAEPKGNLSRFMNHSCLPNCETQKWTVNGDTRIGLFALRDIECGEELTFNYNLVSDGETRKPCLCGAPNCSGFIGLKAQKQQLPALTLHHKKADKTDRIKRTRRSRKHISCWCCGNDILSTDESVTCDQKTCTKMYHKSCLTIENADVRFNCPWHRCAECHRRTSAHCTFCSTAFCQVHLDGNLFEYGDRGGFVCAMHENADAQKSTVEDEKDYSDNDTETDKEYSSTDSNSPIVMEKAAPREPSPRVSIVEVLPSSEESEESQKEEDDESYQFGIESNECKLTKTTKRKAFHRLSCRLQREDEEADKLNNLTSSQLEAIIGGSLVE